MPLTIGTILSSFGNGIIWFFKLGLRKIMVWGFIITMLISAIIIWKNTGNIGLATYEFIKDLIAVDNVISDVIKTIAMRDLTFWQTIYTAWKALGALYFTWFFYFELLYEGLFRGILTNPDFPLFSYLAIMLPMLFCLRVAYFIISAQLLGQEINFLNAKLYFDSITFNWVVVLIKYFPYILDKIAPTVNILKNITSSSVYNNVTKINITNATGV
jgi:hypothetical protein